MTYYDFNGDKIGQQEWSDLYIDIKNRTIDYTKVGRYRISTVWLGLNYNYVPEGKPLIFETMVFDLKDRDTDVGCYRYSTKEEAAWGHQLAVRWAKRRRFFFWQKEYWSL